MVPSPTGPPQRRSRHCDPAFGRWSVVTSQVGQGATATFLDANFTSAGDPVDPVSPLVDIIDALGVEVVTNAVPTRLALGHFTYPSPGYVVSPTAPLGVWRAHWTGTINGSPVASDDLFQVVVAGAIGFDPTTSAELRLRLGDLDTPPIFSDAQIAWLLTYTGGDVPRAAVLGAELLRSRYAGLVDVQEGDVARKDSQKAAGYDKLAETLRLQAAREAAPIPYAGGMSRTETINTDNDVDRTPAYFRTRELGFPWWTDQDLLRRTV